DDRHRVSRSTARLKVVSRHLFGRDCDDLPFAVVAVGPRHGPPMARGGHDLLSVVEPDPVAVLANIDRRDPSHLHRSTIAPEDFIAGRQIADSLEPLGGRDGRVQGEWLRLRGSGNLDEGHIYRFPYNPT